MAMELIAANGSASATELSTALDVDRSSGWRLAKALERVGWLQKVPDSGRYRLGIRLVELGAAVLATSEVRTEARREMSRLAALTGESADLAVRDGDSAVFIDTVDGTNDVRAFTRPGQRAWLHASAAGKVFLAWMPDAEIEDYMGRPLRSLTPSTITAPAELRRAIEETRRRGAGVARGELHPEAGGLAVPVFDTNGSCKAALGLNVPLTRMHEEAVETYIGGLMAAARVIERRARTY